VRYALGALTLLLLAAMAYAANTPAWVQPGVTATYLGVASALENDQPVEGMSVQVTITMRINARQGNTVGGVATIDNPMAMRSDDYPISCVEGRYCDWRFWIDPADPLNSVTGPNGEPMSMIGRGPFEYYGGNAPDATMIGYMDDRGFEYRYTFDSATGLVYAYVEKLPNQVTYLYYRSISGADLSGYQAPAAQQETVPGGQQPVVPGQGQAAGQQGAQGAEEEAGGGKEKLPGNVACGPAFALLLIAGMAWLRGL